MSGIRVSEAKEIYSWEAPWPHPVQDLKGEANKSGCDLWTMGSEWSWWRVPSRDTIWSIWPPIFLREGPVVSISSFLPKPLPEKNFHCFHFKVHMALSESSQVFLSSLDFYGWTCVDVVNNWHDLNSKEALAFHNPGNNFFYLSCW